MGDMDYSELGREIEEKVKKFVNSKEMKDLQENIRETAESTIKEVRRSAKDAADYINKNVEVNREGKATAVKRRLPIIKRPKGGVSGALLSVIGTCGAVIGWTALIIGLVMVTLGGNILSGIEQFIFGTSYSQVLFPGGASIGIILSVFAAAVSAGFTAAAVIGGVQLRRAKRFKTYVKTMSSKDFYSIEKFAQVIGKNNKYVVKDLKEMISRHWFREGHLDEQETCFMLTDEAYKMYLDAQAELALRKEEEEQLRREREMLEQDPAEKQRRLAAEEGKEYIRRIRSVNVDIPGEDISGKLYRLERICTRIFEHIDDNPDKLPDIRKFMNYYLPTTLKLVETYYEFSIQPVQGENITAAKKEIEEVLDNINGAFEKMFDKLFEEDALDISTDISVLSTMLAQEGLLEDEFKV